MAVRAGVLGAVWFAVLLACPSAFALNPSLDMNQYEHHAWTVREGFFKGAIYAIAQTPDGYLWLGTGFGLLRFDGVRSLPWQAPPGEHLPSSINRALLASRDGTLWIGTDEGLASWRDGKLTQYPELAGQLVAALLEDREGTIWAGVSGIPTAKLCAIQRGRAKCYGGDGSLGRGVFLLYEDKRGNLWAGAETGLWRWKPGSPKRYPTPDTPQDLIDGDNGALLIAMPVGIRQLIHGKAEAYPLPGSAGDLGALRLLRDRNGGLWIGTAIQGLWHVHEGRTDVFARTDGLSGDHINALFQDREDDIWVATNDGLDRFRDFAVRTISVKQGLSNASVGSVLAARDGSVWLGTLNGLNRWNDGQITAYHKRGSGLPDDYVRSLFQDDRGRIWVSTRSGFTYLENSRFIHTNEVPGGTTWPIVGDRGGNLWISHDQGLFHLLQGSVVEQVPWARLGRKDYAYALFPDSMHGGLWLGFLNSGVAYFKDGQVRASYAVADGLGHGQVTGFLLDGGGTLWAATQGGLSRVKDDRVATLTSRNGLPCDAVHWVMEDDDHSFWLYTACGLVRIARTELDAWAADPNRKIQAAVFDGSDGVRSPSLTSGFSPLVAKSADGRLWFLPGDGVSFIDPRHLPFNKLPPPVHIEKIVSDRKTRWENLSGAAASKLGLPALSRDLQIDYTALSLVVPEKVRFKYWLEGYDADWQDADNRRQAFYTNLAPRNYRFRVMASNNSGVWNEAGDTLEFSIAPAYYQTTWFLASSVVAVLALLWGLYRYRLHQVAKEFNARMEARVGERTRIARDFHDTLLQSFQGVLLKFSAVKYVMRSRPDEAEEVLERIIDQARAAITEGRDAVQGLRSSTVLTNDLARAIGTFGEGLAADLSSHPAAANGPQFRVQVEGKSRDLPPLVRDEVYHIACESLRNAFRHAQAKRIEVQIRYDPRQFHLRVVDNGKGIDPAVLSAGGRAGHHGLPGINERAELAGGKLSVWSRLDSGTEIELTIPAHIAYTKSTPGRRSMASGRGSG
jgi:ligand-binding sensor domain-containing protein/signal transduction histidine kinase